MHGIMSDPAKLSTPPTLSSLKCSEPQIRPVDLSTQKKQVTVYLKTCQSGESTSKTRKPIGLTVIQQNDQVYNFL